jgi:CCR4-NOT transcription complex subunit 1
VLHALLQTPRVTLEQPGGLCERARGAAQEIVQEQITRVLLERLIVNRPHPWGLLITFIELIKNPRYNFWQFKFTRCAAEIERLFDSVARSCMGPPKGGEEAQAPLAEPARG